MKILLVLLMLCLLTNRWLACAEFPLSREYTIKAAFLYNIAKFVTWPPEAFENDEAPLVLGILGDDPFGSVLDSLAKKSVRGRKLAVKRFKHLEDLTPCQILFISSSEKKDISMILEKLVGRAILTIADIEEFARKGGVLNFVTSKNRVRFEINMDVAGYNRLGVSSQLLKLAKIVKSDAISEAGE